MAFLAYARLRFRITGADKQERARCATLNGPPCLDRRGCQEREVPLPGIRSPRRQTRNLRRPASEITQLFSQSSSFSPTLNDAFVLLVAFDNDQLLVRGIAVCQSDAEARHWPKCERCYNQCPINEPHV